MKEVFGGGEWGFFCWVLVVERWLNNGWEEGLAEEREKEEREERESHLNTWCKMKIKTTF